MYDSMSSWRKKHQTDLIDSSKQGHELAEESSAQTGNMDKRTLKRREESSIKLKSIKPDCAEKHSFAKQIILKSKNKACGDS